MFEQATARWWSTKVYYISTGQTSVLSVSRWLNFLRKVPAKRSQQINSTYHNIVGRNMLCAFGHRVATCYMLHVGCCWLSLKIFKFEPTTPNTPQPNCKRVANRTQYVAPNNAAMCCVHMLLSFSRGWTYKSLCCSSPGFLGLLQHQ